MDQRPGQSNPNDVSDPRPRRTHCGRDRDNIPVTSQLQARLGSDWVFDPWGGLDSSNGGLVIYTPLYVGPRVRTQHPTALEALGQWVPVEGLHTDVMASPPWEVPNWEGHVSHMGITTPQDHKSWVNNLYRSLPHSGMSIISVDRTVSNKGRYNNQMVGGMAAILNTSIGGSSRTWTHHRALGTEVMQYDMDLYCHDPSHGGSYMAEGAFYIRIGLPPRVVSGDCLASSRLWTDFIVTARIRCLVIGVVLVCRFLTCLCGPEGYVFDHMYVRFHGSLYPMMHCTLRT